MISVEAIASSSKGNCYRLKSGSNQLLLEAGIPFNRLKAAINFDLGRIDGCLVSHEHDDHSHCVWQLASIGIDVYMSAGTKRRLEPFSDKAHIIRALEPVKIGVWLITPFATQHDAEEPLGFLISDGEEKLLFATDTYCLPYTFNGLTQIMVECNYDGELLKQRVGDGSISRVLARRLLRSHFSLGNAMEFLRRQDLRLTRQIWLLHCSAVSGDPGLFKSKIQGLTGKPVTVCGK